MKRTACFLILVFLLVQHGPVYPQPWQSPDPSEKNRPTVALEEYAGPERAPEQPEIGGIPDTAGFLADELTLERVWPHDRFDFERALDLLRPDFAAAVVLEESLSRDQIDRLRAHAGREGIEIAGLVYDGVTVLVSGGSATEIPATHRSRRTLNDADFTFHIHPEASGNDKPTPADLAAAASKTHYLLAGNNASAYTAGGVTETGSLAWFYERYLESVLSAPEKADEKKLRRELADLVREMDRLNRIAAKKRELWLSGETELTPVSGLDSGDVTSLPNRPLPVVYEGSSPDTSLQYVSSSQTRLHYDVRAPSEVSGMTLAYDKPNTANIEYADLSKKSSYIFGLMGTSGSVRVEFVDAGGARACVKLTEISDTREKFWRIPASLLGSVNRKKIAFIHFFLTHEDPPPTQREGTLTLRVKGLQTAAPSAPTVTSTVPAVTDQRVFKLEGTKPPYTGIVVNGIEVLPVTKETNWSAHVLLPQEGDNILTVQTVSALGKLSTPRTYTVKFSGIVYPNVVENGGFETDSNSDGKPDGWEITGLSRFITGPRSPKAFELEGTSSNASPSAVQSIALPSPPPFAITLASFLSASDIRPKNGDAAGLAKVEVHFFDQAGNLFKKTYTLDTWEGSFTWRPWSSRLEVPPGATRLEVNLRLDEALGKVAFDDLELLRNLPDDYDRENLVVDGGFDYHHPLSAWALDHGNKIRYPGYRGKAYLETRLDTPGRVVAIQELAIDSSAPVARAELELYYWMDRVQASQPGGGAKIVIEFRDGAGDLIGTSSFGPWTGTKSWTRYVSTVTFPPGARAATLYLLLEDASGTVRWDALRLSAFSGNGVILRPLESKSPQETWQAFEAVPGPLTGPLDLSGLLEGPAGRHGFMKTGSDGHFYFDDGTRARFFGINLQAAQTVPTHREAELLAERLSQLGFNLVRLHHLDAPFTYPNLFDSRFNDTQHLSPQALDRLDYFIAKLKERGIYVYLDLLVSRRFKGGDGVAEYKNLSRGAKAVSQFNPRIIELQKKFARDLLTHLNPYTGNRLVDEPAIVLSEIVNESSLLRLAQEIRDIPQYYLDELKQLWIDYLRQKGVPNPEAQGDRYLAFSDPDVQIFYATLQADFFSDMYAFLKSIGVRYPIAGSNFALDGWDLETNAGLDFIDRHAYWDPPQGTLGNLAKFHNTLITKEIEPKIFNKNSRRINPLVNLSRLRVRNKPFVVSEWNIDWPNEYRAAGPLLMASYANLQDWDAIIQFNYEGNLSPGKIEGNFDISTKPEILFELATAARLFHRGDVSPARARETYSIFGTPGEVPAHMGMTHAVERERGAGFDGSREGKPAVVTSDTGELAWDDGRGLVTINTPRLQAAFGEFRGREVSLDSLTFQSNNTFSALSVASLDGRSIRDSKHLLLTAAARSENQGTVYNATRTQLRSSGDGPILMEPVQGRLSLAGAKPPAHVYALDASGKRIREIPADSPGGIFTVSLTPFPLYEIVFE
jgi:hypothetical protein